MPTVNLAPLKIKVGHATRRKAGTGCTVILFDKPAVCAAHTQGGAPGTRETSLLDPSCLVDRVDAILLTGGSAFGLGTADGVMRCLADKGRGIAVGKDRIPIVPGAVIYDRGYKEAAHPTAADGRKACMNAAYRTPDRGDIGAGTGATAGKWKTGALPYKAGLGIATAKAGRATVTAIVVANPFGNIIDHRTGITVAGAMDKDGQLLEFDNASLRKQPMGNTVIAAVVTDADFTKAELKRIAMMAHDGMAKTINPSHTLYDGDTVFAASTGRKKADLNQAGIAAADAMAEAVLRSVNAR